MRIVIATVVAAAVLWAGAGMSSAGDTPDYLNPQLPVEKRLDDLLARMTLEEKVGQMCQYVGLEHQREVARKKLGEHADLDDAYGFYPDLSPRDVANLVKEGKIGSFLHVVTAKEANALQKLALKSRLKIPLLIGIDAIHGNGLVRGATVYPTPLTLASSWNPALVEEVGRQTAAEMRASGMHWSFTPNVDVARDPRWGRTGETFGEDTYLVSVMGAAMIRGLQQGNSSPLEQVIACAKHIVGGGEPINGLNAAPTDISRRTLYEVFLPPFQAAVDAGAFTVMAAHNEIEGEPCHGSRYLLTDILRKQMGFRGFVVSDWMDIERLYSLHHVVSSEKEAYYRAVMAGVDMHMHGPGFWKGVVELVREGRIPESRIDEAARAILRAKFELGLFEHRFVDPQKIPERVFTPEHREFALKCARESIILLKNDGILPFSPDKKMTLFLTGPNANNHTILGDWTRPQPEDHVVTVLEGLQKVAGNGVTIRYFDCGDDLFHLEDAKIHRAGELARGADVSVVVVGSNSLRFQNDKKTSGENVDRAHINLFGKQLDLVKAVAAAGKPMVVVFVNSRPLAEPWIAEHAGAVLEVWEPGSMGGQAVAEVLFGRVNPSGRLPITIPRSEGQIQMIYNHKPSMYAHRYVDEKITPLYPFGFGLSYTTFELSGLKLASPKVRKGEKLQVSVAVRNTGRVAGSEVVQLYLNDEVSTYTRPVKELKAFQKVHLQPGEQKTVRFTLDTRKLGYYDRDGNYVLEPGWFTVFVGRSSADEKALTGRFELVE